MEKETTQGADGRALAALLAVIALALLVALGGDGEDLARHGAWMGQTRERGAWVTW